MTLFQGLLVNDHRIMLDVDFVPRLTLLSLFRALQEQRPSRGDDL